MSDLESYCVHCGQQCACKGLRKEIEQLKTANKRLNLAVEHCIRVKDFEAHNAGKVADCPLCEAITILTAPRNA